MPLKTWKNHSQKFLPIFFSIANQPKISQKLTKSQPKISQKSAHTTFSGIEDLLRKSNFGHFWSNLLKSPQVKLINYLTHTNCLAKIWILLAVQHCTVFRKAYILSGSGCHEFLYSIIESLKKTHEITKFIPNQSRFHEKNFS